MDVSMSLPGVDRIHRQRPAGRAAVVAAMLARYSGGQGRLWRPTGTILLLR